MPMHQPLPDYVQADAIKPNYYDDEGNAPVILAGLKFMNKIDPNLIESIPISRDYIRNAKKKQSQDKFHKFKKALQLNVFD